MKLSRDRRRSRSAAVARVVESLESRCLLSVTLSTPINSQTVLPDTSPITVNLSDHFSDPVITGTTIEFQTPAGNIPILLADAQTPGTVANFLRYIQQLPSYTDTIIHRSVPGFVLQGGGYTTTGTHVTTFGAIAGEPGISNTTGTIAMALSTGPNSGTSEWFINLGDNNGSRLPNFPNLDDSSNGGPFTAFGIVIYNGMNVANTIANLPIVNASAESGAWTNLPVHDYSGTSTPASVPPENLITTTPIVVPGIGYAASSDNNAVLTATVNNGVLSLTPVPGAQGVANVTVTGTDLGGGTVQSVFTMTVSDGSTLDVQVGTGVATKSLNFVDANGTAGVISYKGPGVATVHFTGSGLSQSLGNKIVNVTGSAPTVASVTITGGTTASALTITTKGGTNAVNIGDINTGTIKSIIGKTATLTGTLTATAGIGSLSLAAATGGAITGTSIGTLAVKGGFNDTLTLVNTGATALGKFTAGSITGGAWAIDGNVTSIAAGASSWTNSITGTVKSMSFKGSVSSTMSVGSITNATIKGDLTSSTIQVTGTGKTLGKLAVSGTITSSFVNSAGDIGTVTAAALIGSKIFAGVGNIIQTQALPNFATDFLTAQTIGAVILKKTTAGGSFINSDIAAVKLGNMSLGTVNIDNSGSVEGIAAEEPPAGFIKVLSGAFGAEKVTLKNITQAVNFGDFVVKLF